MKGKKKIVKKEGIKEGKKIVMKESKEVVLKERKKRKEGCNRLVQV